MVQGRQACHVSVYNLNSAFFNLHSAIRIPKSAMHPMGCMAALNLTWLRAHSLSVSPAPQTGVVEAVVLIVQQVLVESLLVGEAFIHISSPGILRQFGH